MVLRGHRLLGVGLLTCLPKFAKVKGLALLVTTTFLMNFHLQQNVGICVQLGAARLSRIPCKCQPITSYLLLKNNALIAFVSL